MRKLKLILGESHICTDYPILDQLITSGPINIGQQCQYNDERKYEMTDIFTKYFSST